MIHCGESYSMIEIYGKLDICVFMYTCMCMNVFIYIY